MNTCIPVERDLGLESPICMHFGSAPLMMFVDTETGQTKTKAREAGGHGSCAPLALLAGEAVDAVIIGGIGRGALIQLLNSGLPVYQSGAATVSQALSALKSGNLERLDHGAACCGGHEHTRDHEHSCGCGNHD